MNPTVKSCALQLLADPENDELFLKVAQAVQDEDELLGKALHHFHNHNIIDAGYTLGDSYKELLAIPYFISRILPEELLAKLAVEIAELAGSIGEAYFGPTDEVRKLIQAMRKRAWNEVDAPTNNELIALYNDVVPLHNAALARDIEKHSAGFYIGMPEDQYLRQSIRPTNAFDVVLYCARVTLNRDKIEQIFSFDAAVDPLISYFFDTEEEGKAWIREKLEEYVQMA